MKVKSLKEVEAITRAARRTGKTIVTTNGCFDILHIGHVRNLKAAKKLGDVLIVGLNSDASVRLNKGSSRPIIPARERAELLAALESVDYVFIFSDPTPFAWIQKLRPHIHVKGGGKDILKHPNFLPQKKIIEESGGRFILLPHIEDKSTSRIIKKIIGK
jgi:rfaE bifunctional protein nucleotidyltransferase chain/domain